MNALRQVKWLRNAGPALVCAITCAVMAPHRWYFGLLGALGFYLFAGFVDLVLFKLLKPDRGV